MSSVLFLHKTVFSGDSELVEQLLKSLDEKQINSQDIHGNTALHIAVMKGNERCVELLIKSGAITTIRNELNWTPFHESISFGNIPIIKLVLDAVFQRMHRLLKREFLFQVMKDIKEDFIMKFDVRFKVFNPSETTGPPEVKTTITKKGLKFKIDLIVHQYNHLRPDSFHFIVNFNENSDSFITITVGENVPIYQNITHEEWEQILGDLLRRDHSDEVIRNLMQKDNQSIKFEKDRNHIQQTLFRKLRTKKVGKYKTEFYETQGIDFQTKKRTEHLRAREQTNTNTNGGSVQSLPTPTTRSHVSWDEYIHSPKGMFPYLGRKTIETIESKRVSIVVGLTHEIPVDWHWILNLISKLFIEQFMENISQLTKELPKGFPVVIDFPINPLVYLKYRCRSFEITNDIEDSLFVIPEVYERRTIFEIQRNS